MRANGGNHAERLAFGGGRSERWRCRHPSRLHRGRAFLVSLPRSGRANGAACRARIARTGPCRRIHRGDTRYLGGLCAVRRRVASSPAFPETDPGAHLGGLFAQSGRPARHAGLSRARPKRAVFDLEFGDRLDLRDRPRDRGSGGLVTTWFPLARRSGDLGRHRVLLRRWCCASILGRSC
jgi:hypothetical protein